MEDLLFSWLVILPCLLLCQSVSLISETHLSSLSDRGHSRGGLMFHLIRKIFGNISKDVKFSSINSWLSCQSKHSYNGGDGQHFWPGAGRARQAWTICCQNTENSDLNQQWLRGLWARAGWCQSAACQLIMMFSSHLRSAPDKHVLPPLGRGKGWPVNIEQEPEMFTLIKLTSIPQSHSTGCLTKARLSFTTKSSAHFMVIKLILYVRFGFYFCKYICFLHGERRGEEMCR